ncbi:MAG: aminotransferase class IV [Flavobacterium sp.]
MSNSNKNNLSVNENRAFLYADALFETVKIVQQKVLYLEDHYFRLMASMRILRMKIPMEFSMEYFEQQLLDVIPFEDKQFAHRVRMTVYRNPGGKYLPTDLSVSFEVQVEKLSIDLYVFSEETYEIELYKDFYIPSGNLLSNLKSTSKLPSILGSIWADENGYQNALLLNQNKNIVEALNGNVFMLMGNKLITPSLSEGCLNGIMRKQVISIMSKNQEIEVEESIISPFDLQKADEIFITNVITGIRSVSKYRKKEYTYEIAKKIISSLNAQIRFN